MESCPIDLAWEYKQGVKEYIQSKTEEDPYYALVTGALHGAPVDYTQTQPYVDEIIRRGAREFTDADRNAEFLNTPITPGSSVYAFSRARAPVLAGMSKCYIDQLDGGADETTAAMHCTREERTGIGRKGMNLMLEYLGDDDAVAVDRHVYRYICDRTGVCPNVHMSNHGIVIPEQSQKISEEKLKEIARDCDKSPVDVQVAAWLKGACDSKIRARIRGRGQEGLVELGPDKIIDCKKRFYESPTLPKVRPRVEKPMRRTKIRGMKLLEMF